MERFTQEYCKERQLQWQRKVVFNFFETKDWSGQWEAGQYD